MYDVAIIGCGIVGAATAYELSKHNLSVVVIEKENDVANGTSKANSAILHAGYDAEPGTLMARLNVEGSRLAEELCKKLDVPYKKLGSLVLAFEEDELETLKILYQRGVTNKVPELSLISAEQVREIEPNLSSKVKGALLAKSAAIVSPWEYTLALAETAVRNGVKLQLDCEVTGIDHLVEVFRITTTKEEIEASYIVNAAGVYSDRIHNMVAEQAFEVQPSRGQYYLLDKVEGSRVSHVIFQCPGKEGKGVLVAPTVHGNLIVGPNSESAEDADDTATTAEGLAMIMETAKKSVPLINFRENIRNFSGLRAVADIDDFIIEEAKAAKGFINLAGIKSPGLTAAPAIAKMAIELLEKSGLELKQKSTYCDSRKRIRFEELTIEEKNELIKKNPAYGRVTCRCETITEGEIVDAVHSPITPYSLDSVKRRCNAGMGRCQGGFCGPRVLELISRELGIQKQQVLQDKVGSVIITGETKMGGIANV